MKSYFEVKIGPVAANEKDDLSVFCFDHGCLGIAETLPFKQHTLKYEPEISESRPGYFSVYFDNRPSEDFFLLLNSRFPQTQTSIAEEQHQDWLKIWKENFVPFKFADPYWIVPSWHKPPVEADKYLVIDPGMAFGTGTHETTTLAAQWIMEHVNAGRSLRSTIDVGSGTGILAMITKREGAERVLGIDIDPECVRVSRENLKTNNLSDIEFSDRLLSRVEGQFDLVIANIVSGILMDLKVDLLRVLKVGGYIITTGILLEERENFLKDFTAGTHLQLIGERSKGEWISFYFQKMSNS